MLPVLYNLAPGIISQRTNHLIKTLTHRLHPWPQALNNQSRTSTLISPQASSGIHSDIDSAQSCQLLCVQTEDCVAFSWHFGSEQFDENTCQLFSGFSFHTFTFTYPHPLVRNCEETSSCFHFHFHFTHFHFHFHFPPPSRSWRGDIKLLRLCLWTKVLHLLWRCCLQCWRRVPRSPRTGGGSTWFLKMNEMKKVEVIYFDFFFWKWTRWILGGIRGRMSRHVCGRSWLHLVMFFSSLFGNTNDWII